MNRGTHVSALSLLVAFPPTPIDDIDEQPVPEHGEELLMAQIAQISVEDIRSTTVPSSRGRSADGRAEVEHVAAEVERKSDEPMDVEASGSKRRDKNPTNTPHACEFTFILLKILFTSLRTMNTSSSIPRTRSCPPCVHPTHRQDDFGCRDSHVDDPSSVSFLIK